MVTCGIYDPIKCNKKQISHVIRIRSLAGSLHRSDVTTEPSELREGAKYLNVQYEVHKSFKFTRKIVRIKLFQVLLHFLYLLATCQCFVRREKPYYEI